jgi:hypothetical protein
MSSQFSQIPQVVVDFIRNVFEAANDKVSRTMCAHPSMHEETLDHTLVMELSASPSAYFAQERMAVSIQSHWLGSRAMFNRWEIADIAFFIMFRKQGHLEARKVALLQTKRLYSREIPVHNIDEFDYRIGMGRIVDNVDLIASFPSQRKFQFNNDCEFGALSAGHEQVVRIDAYLEERGIPVYYGFYNPVRVPFDSLYPALNGEAVTGPNELGMRVLTSTAVHKAIASMRVGTSPTLEALKTTPLDRNDPNSMHGWRLEKFIADEVLSCREGKLFDKKDDPNLQALLYRRSAPITAAISITIDLLGD